MSAGNFFPVLHLLMKKEQLTFTFILCNTFQALVLQVSQQE